MENETNQQPTYQKYTSTEKEKKPNFWKNAFVPFCSSALATIFVIGVCFGNSNIRNKILNSNTTYTSNGLTITEGPVSNTVAIPILRLQLQRKYYLRLLVLR